MSRLLTNRIIPSVFSETNEASAKPIIGGVSNIIPGEGITEFSIQVNEDEKYIEWLNF